MKPVSATREARCEPELRAVGLDGADALGAGGRSAVPLGSPSLSLIKVFSSLSVPQQNVVPIKP